MKVRDVLQLDAALQAPFDGYAVQRRIPLVVDLDRAAALVGILGMRIVPGILLGRPRPALKS